MGYVSLWKTHAHCRVRHPSYHAIVETRSCSDPYIAHAFLEASLFSTYRFTLPEPSTSSTYTEIISFSISLAALMELLSIYNPSSQQNAFSSSNNMLRMGGTLRITYQEFGSALDLVLEENGVITTCSLTTYEPDNLAELELEINCIPDKIIMRSEWLSDAMIELDSHGGDVLSIRQSPQRPWLRLSVKGILGSAQMDYPNDRSVLETFSCKADVKNSYKFSMIRPCLKAMAASEKVSIRTDDLGTLAIQFMIAIGEGRHSFVEFKILALDEDEHENEGGDAVPVNAEETLDF